MLKLVTMLLISTAVVSSALDNKYTLQFKDDSRTCEEILSEKAFEIADGELKRLYPFYTTISVNKFKIERRIDVNTLDLIEKAVVFQMGVIMDPTFDRVDTLEFVPLYVVQNQPCVLDRLDP